MFCRFGIVARQAPRHRHRLRVRRVDAPGLGVHHQRQLVGVGALQLREAAVLEQLARQRVVGGELLQHVLVGRRRAARGLAADRQAELAEQDLADLLRAAEVERLAGDVVGLLLERGHALGELLALRREQRRVDQDAGALDPAEHGRGRHLDAPVDVDAGRARPRSAARAPGARAAPCRRPRTSTRRRARLRPARTGSGWRPCRRRLRRSARCGRDGGTPGSRACAPCAPPRRSSRAWCRARSRERRCRARRRRGRRT